MKRTILGVAIAMAGYIIGCKTSYELGYEKGHKESIFNYELGWKAAVKYVYKEKPPKEVETTDKEKSE